MVAAAPVFASQAQFLKCYAMFRMYAEEHPEKESEVRLLSVSVDAYSQVACFIRHLLTLELHWRI